MATRLEDKIRRHLAEHLEILEEGLTLLHEEYVIPNTAGASGRVDIIAKDIFGNVVVIEIKRSNQASREALHELNKYTSLLRIRQGLTETSVRVMIVSTEWHELLVPLSEYSRNTRYKVNGFKIEVSTDGLIHTVEQMKLLPAGTSAKLSHCQGVYLFENSLKRERAVDRLRQLIESSYIKDYLLISIEFNGLDDAVVYKHGLYLAFVSPLSYLSQHDLVQVKKMISWDDELDSLDENFVCAINDNPSSIWDDYETGYPEKLATIIQSWTVCKMWRHGRLDADVSLISDDDLLRMATAFGGGSSIYIGKFTSPQFVAAWDELKSDTELITLGNEVWSELVPLYLHEIELKFKEASVSVYAYSLMNLPMTLLYLGRQDYSRCPKFEIVVNSKSSQEMCILMSRLAWNGKSVLDTPEGMMKRIYGGLQDWALLTSIHEVYPLEDLAMALHGLSTPFVELIFKHGENPEVNEILVSDDQIVRSPFHAEHKDISDFMRTNRAYVSSLHNEIRQIVNGI